MATLQAILQRHFKDYRESHRLSVAQRRAGHALLVCRTAALGGHVSRCPNGHLERVWYNSCRHRSCPQCNGLSRERWLARMRARLIGCAHHHLIFTIPHELNVLWMLNTPAMMRALFAAVRSTLTELLADPRYLGAQAGAVLALHTWSRSLALHPHIHVLVSDGGLSSTGAWVTPRRSHFLPARVVMMLFRGKLLGAVRALHRAGALRLPERLSEAHFDRLLNRLGRVKWVAVVSDDVPLDDRTLLLWGIFTRFDAARDVVFSGMRLDGAWPRYRGRMAIDATWKPGYPDPIEMDPEVVRLVDRRWGEYGIRNEEGPRYPGGM